MPSLEQIVAAARALGEDFRVPYAFEKRISAQIAARQEAWMSRARLLWRAAFGCVAIAIVSGAIIQYGARANSPEALALDLEQTVTASIQVEESW